MKNPNVSQSLDSTKKQRAKLTKRLQISAIILIVIGILLISYPFVPMLKFRIAPPTTNDYPFPTKLSPATQTDTHYLPENQTKKLSYPVNALGIPTENRLVIPKIGVNAKIITSSSESALNRGVWHLFDTSNPALGGNTVISGHRFRYRPPNNTTFYLLDKLGKGDTFIVYWQEKEYDYRVTETKVIEPNDRSILQNTDNPRVTLFTCTPLFTTKQRLVVIGELIED